VETNIRTAREAIGMTLPTLAEMTGINKGHLSEIERGIRIPDNDQVSAIAEAIGSPVEMWVRLEVKPR
jgi:transcriptional regulator with XRE-family HTH domain